MELSNHTTPESEIWLGDYQGLVSEVGFLAACVYVDCRFNTTYN